MKSHDCISFELCHPFICIPLSYFIEQEVLPCQICDFRIWFKWPTAPNNSQGRHKFGENIFCKSILTLQISAHSSGAAPACFLLPEVVPVKKLRFYEGRVAFNLNCGSWETYVSRNRSSLRRGFKGFCTAIYIPRGGSVVDLGEVCAGKESKVIIQKRFCSLLRLAWVISLLNRNFLPIFIVFNDLIKILPAHVLPCNLFLITSIRIYS